MRCTLSTVARYRGGGLLLLLLLSFSARAATEKVEEQIKKIEKTYKEPNYEQARNLVAKAQKETLTREQEVTLWLYDGILSYELGQDKRGDASIQQALSLQCNARPPVEVSPKIIVAIERVRSAIPQRICDPPPPSRLQKLALIPAIAGGAVAIAGGSFFAVSRLNQLNRLRNNDPRISSAKDAKLIAYQGQTFQTLGGSLLGLGAAGLATSALMYLLGAPPKPSVALGAGADGTSVFFYGRWP